MNREELDAKTRELNAELNAGKFGTGVDTDWDEYDRRLIALQDEFCRDNPMQTNPVAYIPNAEDFE